MTVFQQPEHTLTTDVVLFAIVDDQLQVLTITRPKEPFAGTHTLPGGFLRLDETSKDAAERVLEQKAGLKNMFIEQLYTFDSPTRDPRGHFLSISYMAAAHPKSLNFEQLDTVENPSFVSLSTKLSFDHQDIVEYALQRLKYKLEYSSIASSLLPQLFTFAQLQRVYEIVLGHDLDKRNFRKKFSALDLIEATDKKQKGLQQRPAVLYKFKSKKFREFKRWF